ncbi:MAG: DUF1707 SHOCT-like domain-containing protein [Micromonosporaceae bacterium]
MAADPRIRAADADREQAAARLREHFAAGRLTSEEFSERLDGVYASTTLGELEDLMTDLPGSDLAQLPATAVRRSAGHLPVPRQRAPGSIETPRGRFSPAWRAAWSSWLAISLCAFMIWLLTGASGGLWFLWVAAPLGALLLARWITGASRLSPVHMPVARGSSVAAAA